MPRRFPAPPPPCPSHFEGSQPHPYTHVPIHRFTPGGEGWGLGWGVGSTAVCRAGTANHCAGGTQGPVIGLDRHQPLRTSVHIPRRATGSKCGRRCLFKHSSLTTIPIPRPGRRRPDNCRRQCALRVGMRPTVTLSASEAVPTALLVHEPAAGTSKGTTRRLLWQRAAAAHRTAGNGNGWGFERQRPGCAVSNRIIQFSREC